MKKRINKKVRCIACDGSGYDMSDSGIYCVECGGRKYKYEQIKKKNN